MRLAVLLAVSVAASGCLAHTARERRQRGGVALATGAALVVGGVLLYREAQTEGGLLVSLAEATGGGLMVAGGLPTTAIGAFNILSSFGPDEVVTERPPPPLETAEQQSAACATWQSNHDAERDPTRRTALETARPAHCRAASSR